MRFNATVSSDLRIHETRNLLGLSQCSQQQIVATAVVWGDVHSAIASAPKLRIINWTKIHRPISHYCMNNVDEIKFFTLYSSLNIKTRSSVSIYCCLTVVDVESRAHSPCLTKNTSSRNIALDGSRDTLFVMTGNMSCLSANGRWTSLYGCHRVQVLNSEKYNTAF